MYFPVSCVGSVFGLDHIWVPVFLLGIVPLLMTIAFWNSNRALAVGFLTALFLPFIVFMAWGMIFWQNFPGPGAIVFHTF